jgi:hypothetical protein
VPLREGAVRERTDAELQKWSTENGIVWLTVLSSGKSRSDYLEPTKAETFNKARGGVPSALLIDASGDMGHAYGACGARMSTEWLSMSPDLGRTP